MRWDNGPLIEQTGVWTKTERGVGRKERRLAEWKRMCEEEQEKVCDSWWSYFSGVDLLSVDGVKKLWLALLQFDPIGVHL